MGWYHLTQLLNDERAQVHAVIEPWYLGAGGDAPGSDAYHAFAREVANRHPLVSFHSSVEQMPRLDPSEGPALAIIALRTQEAPQYFKAACTKGISHIYLEKPGAVSAEQLVAMMESAAGAGVEVVIGYNKNVSDYVQDALAEWDRCLVQDKRQPLITLEHNNPFTQDNVLEFLSGPGSEGMLHNMSCHELALAATFFDVSCKRIESVTLHREQSEPVDVNGRKDWKKVSYTINMTEEEGKLNQVSFSSDRCGGNYSCVHVRSDSSMATFKLPSAKHAAWVEEMEKQNPDTRSYFFLQASDYERLKGRFLDHIIAGHPGVPAGTVSFAGAIETLHLADFLKPVLEECLNKGPPWTWTV